MDSVNRMIRLTIAGSDGVKDEVVDHLTKIWEILQALSNEYAKGRPDEYAKRRPDECGRRSPEIPEDVGLPLRQDLFRNVYKFSLRRHMKRVEKWWPVLVFFMSELHKRRKGVVQDILDQHLNRVSSGLSRLLKAFEKLYEYPQKDLTDDEWKMMFSQDAFVAYSTKLALENRGGEGLETLTNELEGIPLLLLIAAKTPIEKYCTASFQKFSHPSWYYDTKGHNTVTYNILAHFSSI